jgi:hypothetical protein
LHTGAKGQYNGAKEGCVRPNVQYLPEEESSDASG